MTFTRRFYFFLYLEFWFTREPHAFHAMKDLNTIFDCILPLLRCLLVNILARQGNGARTEVQNRTEFY